MRIGISATGKTEEDRLDMRFGRCEYFQIYDTETEEIKTVENKGQSASGGAGIAASNQLVDEKVDAIITGSLGPNAFEIIEKAQIKTYTCETIAINLVLQKYKNNELKLISMSGPAHQGGSF